MSSEKDLKISIDKEKIVNKNFFKFLFCFYLLSYPFLFFNIPILKFLIKYPTIIISFLFLIPYTFSKFKFKFHLIYLFIIILTISYMRFDLFGSLEYVAFGGLTIIFSTVFEKERYIKLFINCYTFLGVLISIHALFQFIIVFSGLIDLFNFEEINSVGSRYPFNIFLGVIDSVDISKLRVSSFFPESNRLGYFLLPLIFLYMNYKKKFSNLFFLLFLTVILLTKSFATIGVIILLRAIFFKKYRILFISLLLVLFYLIVIQLNECSLTDLCSTDFSSQIDRGKSIAQRLASLFHITVTLPANPFGISLNDFDYYTNIAPTYTAIVFWSLVGGWISMISIFFLILFIILRNISFINSFPYSPYKGLCIGIIGYSFLEFFMGNGFAGLFSVLVSLTLSLPVNSRLSLL